MNTYILPTKDKGYQIYIRLGSEPKYYDTLYCHSSVAIAIAEYLHTNLISKDMYDNNYEGILSYFSDYVSEVGQFCSICDSGNVQYTYEGYSSYNTECQDCGHITDIC
jgi:hypothetical protein